MPTMHFKSPKLPDESEKLKGENFEGYLYVMCGAELLQSGGKCDDDMRVFVDVRGSTDRQVFVKCKRRALMVVGDSGGWVGGKGEKGGGGGGRLWTQVDE